MLLLQLVKQLLAASWVDVADQSAYNSTSAPPARSYMHVVGNDDHDDDVRLNWL